ncbi:MAG: ABC transporter substrate-binding protein [Chloroflexota bacterium]
MKSWTILFVASLLAACAVPAAPTAPGSTWFQFWFTLTGAPGEATIEIAKRFNAAQTRCLVELAPQDSLDDALNKIKTGWRSKDIPALAHVSNLALPVLIDLQVIQPMQTYVDRDKFDLGDFEPNMLAYYSDGGKLYGMPFNVSAPILYYNKTAFQAAGLDPNKPPRTYAQVTQAARKLTKQGADGKVAMYGYSMAISGWFFEQLLAASGGLYLDNGNGRDARATKAVFNSPEGVAILKWWKEGFDAGVFGNLGRATADTQKAFDAQHVAMIVDSSAALRARVDAAQGKFELGAGFLPRPDEAAFQKFGTIIGGASIFILKDRSDAEKKCAWEFVKFALAPEIQAYWHTTSGYYPIVKRAYAMQDAQDWIAQYPQFSIAVEQLRAAPNNRVTQGALTGAMPAARQRIENAIEQALQGKATPQQALDRAAADVTKLIADYNKIAPGK